MDPGKSSSNAAGACLKPAGDSSEGNSIHGNGGLGIELVHGSNRGQVAPQLVSAVLSTGTAISGSLTGTAPGTEFVIELFASPGARDFIGRRTVTTNTSSNNSFNFTLPAIVASGREIIATATSQLTGDTSEFSDPVTVSSVDGDFDGMPNAYESATPGHNPALAADAALDFDCDGLSNLQEFVAGTNPNDSTSRLVTMGVMDGSNFQVSIATVSGKFYRLERSGSLSGFWETVALHLEGTGGIVTVPLTVSPAISRQFFRVTAGQ